MLTDAGVERILAGIPGLTIGVLGDLFLDRYLDIDATLTEPSIETGLDAYQVVRVRPSPGAAGTVINNLVALGVKQVVPISVVGDDGEGYELLQALRQLRVVSTDAVHRVGDPNFRTPTYTKPMLAEPGRPPRELNRLDIRNRKPLARPLENDVLPALDLLWPVLDALLVLDQVGSREVGVVTASVRDRLKDLGVANTDKVILADSRERTADFRFVWLKPNEAECLRATNQPDIGGAMRELSERTQRPVFCTRGDQGIMLADPRRDAYRAVAIPGYPVTGPIDVVGAGDSTSAGIVCALASGASLEEAAAFGNLIASITIQQLGTTGTATPAQVRQRWQEVQHSPPSG